MGETAWAVILKKMFPAVNQKMMKHTESTPSHISTG